LVDKEKQKMKLGKHVSLPLVALTVLAGSGRAQSVAAPPKSLDPRVLLNPSGSRETLSTAFGPAMDALASGLATTAPYDFASADFPGAAFSTVFDKNLTTILGDTELVANPDFGFTLKGSSYRLFDLPETLGSVTLGLNSLGQIVGTYGGFDGAVHGFLDTHGTLVNIDHPLAQPSATVPYEVNDAGEVVGYFVDARNNFHGFSTYDGVTFNTVDFPGAGTTPFGLNNAGDIVGQWVDAQFKGHGFLLHGGQFTSFDFPLAADTQPFGINDGGQIAGSFTDANGRLHGFIYASSTFYQVDVAGAEQTELTRIKNNGDITGDYFDLSHERHGLTGRKRD
jgi:probable HAF family extracellular repeat protein